MYYRWCQYPRSSVSLEELTEYLGQGTTDQLTVHYISSAYYVTTSRAHDRSLCALAPHSAAAVLFNAATDQ